MLFTQHLFQILEWEKWEIKETFSYRGIFFITQYMDHTYLLVFSFEPLKCPMLEELNN